MPSVSVEDIAIRTVPLEAKKRRRLQRGGVAPTTTFSRRHLTPPRATQRRLTTDPFCVRVEPKPRLLSDNGPCYVAKDLAAYLKQHGLGHTRGRPYHPMTQGKIERYHRSMKNVVRLENHYSPWELERALARFIEYYNHERLHEAIGNVTPDDMYHGRHRAILSRREKIKRLTLERRKKENLRNAAQPQMGARTLSKKTGPTVPEDLTTYTPRLCAHPRRFSNERQATQSGSPRNLPGHWSLRQELSRTGIRTGPDPPSARRAYRLQPNVRWNTDCSGWMRTAGSGPRSSSTLREVATWTALQEVREVEAWGATTWPQNIRPAS